MGKIKARARLEWYRGSSTYTVVDTRTNCIVIQTTSYTVADYWRTRVNGCSHPLHYDITDHDRIVSEWLDGNGLGGVENGERKVKSI